MDYNLNVTQAEADLIGAALGKLPLEQVMGVFTKLMAQCNAQNAARAEATAQTAGKLSAEAAMQVAHATQAAANSNLTPADLTPAAPAPEKPASTGKKKKGSATAAAAPAGTPLPAASPFVAAQPVQGDGLPVLPALPHIPNFG